MSQRLAAVFGYNSTEPRVVKRIRGFQRNGLEVVGLCFFRRRLKATPAPEWDNIHLGTIPDRQYLLRVFALIRAGVRVFRERHRYASARFFYAYNLDMALLAILARWASGRPIPIAYEVGDVQPPLLWRGLRGRVVRAAERWVLRQTQTLVVTSPGFVRNYFEPIQGFDGNWILLENKVLPAPPVPRPDARTVLDGDSYRRRRSQGKWVIGLFGAIRCGRSWEIIKELAIALPEQVEFVLRGYPTGVLEHTLPAEVADLPNVRFEGKYRTPDDLPAMYDEVDFVWGFELLQPRHNSAWLLPTRLYEGGYFGVPFLTPSGFEVGRYVEERQIGWTFPQPYASSLFQFFRSLDGTEYEARCRAFDDMGTEALVGKEDHRLLTHQLLELDAPQPAVSNWLRRTISPPAASPASKHHD